MDTNINVAKYELEIGYDKTTGLPKWLTIRREGQFDSPIDDRPAHVVFDELGRPSKFGWYSRGVLHRENGPASMTVDPDTGIVTVEDYRHQGTPHRSLREPAYIERDAKTGQVLLEMFFVKGMVINPKHLGPAPN